MRWSRSTSCDLGAQPSAPRPHGKPNREALKDRPAAQARRPVHRNRPRLSMRRRTKSGSQRVLALVSWDTKSVAFADHCLLLNDATCSSFNWVVLCFSCVFKLKKKRTEFVKLYLDFLLGETVSITTRFCCWSLVKMILQPYHTHVTKQITSEAETQC